MNIGIDIDDTIVVTTKQMLKYADRYNKERFGKEELSKKFGMLKDRYYINSIYGWNEEIKFEFFHKYYKNILEECTFLENVPKILRMLKNDGHKLYFISARITGIEGCDTYTITKNMLEDSNIKYDKLICDAYNKLPFAKENNIDIFIDDVYDICNNMQKNQIKALLINTNMNENIQNNNIERVYGWNDIYSKINEYKNRM